MHLGGLLWVDLQLDRLSVPQHIGGHVLPAELRLGAGEDQNRPIRVSLAEAGKYVGEEFGDRNTSPGALQGWWWSNVEKYNSTTIL